MPKDQSGHFIEYFYVAHSQITVLINDQFTLEETLRVNVISSKNVELPYSQFINYIQSNEIQKNID